MKNLFMCFGFVLVAWLNAIAVTAQTANANSNASAITGRVLSDDGVPVARIGVSLLVAGGTVVMGTERAVLTDAEGRFRFTNVSPAAYSVRAFLPGYIASAGNSASNYARRGDDVTLNLVKGGVISGKVTNNLGEPVIALNVLAQMVKDAEGKPPGNAGWSAIGVTNDLGEYRIYGLQAGTYIVGKYANSGGLSFVSAHDLDVPVYYPSATRETAGEVKVQLGAETDNVNIRYRSELGHRISGSLEGANADSPFTYGSSVAMRALASDTVVASAEGMPTANGHTFEFNGVTDGEYELTASRSGESFWYRSAPRRVTVKGGNVTGVALKLEPQATLSGRVSLEPGSAEAGTKCPNVRAGNLTETLVSLQRDQYAKIDNQSTSAAVNAKGEFKIQRVATGNFHLQLNLPSPAWYLKSVTKESAAQNANTFSGGMFVLRSGDAVTGVRVTLAEGAARVSGKVTTADGKPAGRARVQLVPAEDKDAANVWAYAETEAAADGTFSLNNLMPGKYCVLALPLPDKPQAPLAFDVAARAKLRKQAASAGKDITLAACQHEQNFQANIGKP